jgi:arylsulfatase A-like enzyme
MADDLGYGDLGCYGNPFIETPNIDKLADKGLKFTQFYAGAPVCTPTRASFLTGQFPLRFDLNYVFMDKNEFLPVQDINIPKLLKARGFITNHIGKWHLGGIRKMDIEARNQKQTANPGPLEHGYDYYISNIEDGPTRGELFKIDQFYQTAGLHLVCNDTIVPPIKDHWTKIKADKVIELIDVYNDENRKFFFSINFFVPHVPYEKVPGKWIEYYRDKEAEGLDLLYRSMISYMDEQIGCIVEKLESENQFNNTLIVFTSDNGPAFEGSTKFLKGRKSDLHDGGIRVPMIISWPDRIKDSKTTDLLSHSVDILPTFYEAAGGNPEEIKLDGVSLFSHIVNSQTVERDYPLIWFAKKAGYYPEPNRAMTDTMLFKSNFLYGKFPADYAKPRPIADFVIRKDKWKLFFDEGKPIQLYNMEVDPGENNNLLGLYPDLEKSLLKHFSKYIQEPRIKCK